MNKFVQNQITYWLKSAEFDLPVADSLYAKKVSYSNYMVNLTI